MTTPRAFPVATSLLALALAGRPCAGESLVTVRVGSQDSCGLGGATSLTWDGKSKQSRLRIDVSRLPRGAEIETARLRFWVPGADPRGAVRTEWGFQRWREPGFEGFKVWAGAAPKPDALLDTQYPFHTPTYWLMEFDVTPAVRKWVGQRPSRATKPAAASNDGLTTNFRFPAGPDSPAELAWQRPHLQVTYAGPNPNRPKQPAGLKALYRSGQVFLTWRQGPREGAFFDSTCRVYRHDRAITAANLGKAELLGEVHRLSQLNSRRTLTARGGDYGPWKYYVQAAGEPAHKKGESRKDRMARVLPLIPKRFNFVIDAGWPERIRGGQFLRKVPPSDKVQIYQGPQLADDCGLFVHTCRAAGKAHYAVTSVEAGNENRQDFSPGNALSQPVREKVAEPKPVLQAVFTANGPGGYQKVGKFQIREYVYWGGSDGRFHTEPSTPFAFTFHVPRRWVGLGYDHGNPLDREFPAWVRSLAKVAGYSISYWDGSGIVMDTAYVPPRAGPRSRPAGRRTCTGASTRGITTAPGGRRPKTHPRPGRWCEACTATSRRSTPAPTLARRSCARTSRAAGCSSWTSC